jgi:hypothetical protein
MSGRATSLAVLLVACAPKVPPNSGEPWPEARDPERRTQRDDNDELWTVVRAEHFVIAIPDGWRELTVPDEAVQLLRVGDGIGIPPLDEYGAPLQAGFVVEKVPGIFPTPEALADELLGQLDADPSAHLIGPPMRRGIALCDGRPAEFVAVEFVREGEERKSLFTQVLTSDDEGVGWATSGYLITGADSHVSTMDSLAATWMAAHALSFCFDPKQFDEAGVREAYAVMEQVDASISDGDESDEKRLPIDKVGLPKK